MARDFCLGAAARGRYLEALNNYDADGCLFDDETNAKNYVTQWITFPKIQHLL